MDEIEHPGWCDPVHCTATIQKPEYRTGETGFHRSSPVLVELPHAGEVVFDPTLNPLTAHLARAANEWDPVTYLNVGPASDPQLLSLPAGRARQVLAQLGDLLARTADA